LLEKYIVLNRIGGKMDPILVAILQNGRQNPHFSQAILYFIANKK
jgi:hypothetical protein